MQQKIKGIALALAVAALAGLVKAFLPENWHLSLLILAIVLGVVVGNVLPTSIRSQCDAGLNWMKGPVLRLAIILYGFNVTLQEVGQVGSQGILLALLMVTLISVVGVIVGRRWLGLDSHSSLLIASGSAVCGAAAVAAVEPVLKAAPYKVAVAVATVVIFGSLSMFIYPLLFPYTGFSESQYGLWVGAAVHEVAQVVVAGAAVSADAAHIAVTEKMIRVMMLVPLLLVISIQQTGIHSLADVKRIKVPWFAVAFLAVIVANSWFEFLAPWRDYFTTAASLLLALAMAALGVLTHLSVLKKAGARAMLLATLLFVLLISVSGLVVALF